ncbi:SPFH domain-containing protein [uncultured Adlercreutzia sp.]|uniref:SPFH domain-containing protein n=1 Tax=uncultured Adlercreutzia sp. TaxID=875803 RepID=UPI0025FF0925|nr:SPFH domain-containing protein [uncultured Adlercreutzia sp.]MCI9261584.1 SPFH/Band 7/PHB domain protein [Eggerthellaceae bacterium]
MWIVGVVVAIAIIAMVVMGVRIVRPYERGVVERFGKYKRTAQSGFRWIIPFVDRMTKVDMRENVVDVPPMEVITKDNVAVTVDAVVYYRATDAVKLIYNVTNFYLAATKLAQTNLRNVIGELTLDESLTSRETINANLKNILYDATMQWGVEIVRVELQRIEPPADVTQAMHRQMKAEREKRAVILEAEGERQAAIEKAEGVKQSSILEAEGKAQAIREVADAEKQQRVLASEGEAQAVANVLEQLHAEDTDSYIAVRYVESLKAIADGNATKIFMPTELTGIASATGMIGELFQGSKVTPQVKAAEPGQVPPPPEVR